MNRKNMFAKFAYAREVKRCKLNPATLDSSTCGAARESSTCSEPPTPTTPDHPNPEKQRNEPPRLHAPFVAPFPNRYRDRFGATCLACFEKSQVCTCFPERKLKLLIVGHNPSEHAWEHGYFYGNPTNRMWKLLTGESISKDAVATKPFRGVFPRGSPMSVQNMAPLKFRVGFVDLGTVPGNVASEFGKRTVRGEFLPDFYRRMRLHILRCANEEGNQRHTHVTDELLEKYAPDVVAFAGKSHFKQLFPGNLAVDFGECDQVPPDWPFKSYSRILLLPSSSGRAVMKAEQRQRPYRELAEAYHGNDSADEDERFRN